MANASGTRIMMSWNTHSLITWFAASRYFGANPGLPVKVTSIESLIDDSRDDLSKLAESFQHLLYHKLGIGKQHIPVKRDIVSLGDFLDSFRLNPGTQIQYVRVFDPAESNSEMTHDPSREGPPGHSYYPTNLGSEIPAFAIYCTFSDEPDWGMDQEIFTIRDYRMGRPPFGPDRGKSSQAPFHMAFPHENSLTYWIVPGLAKGLLSIRAAMNFSLSEIAFDKGCDYWGWRFAAWGTHYLQDITCPFHCCPFPPEKKNLLMKFLLNPNPFKFYENNKNYLRNRHSLLEATVCYLMNEGVKKRASNPLLEVLEVNIEELPGELDAVIEQVSLVPYKLASKINDLMVDLFSSPLIDKPDYYLNDDAEFAIGEALGDAIKQRPSVYSTFVDLVCRCLSEAGRVTRFAIEFGRR